MFPLDNSDVVTSFRKNLPTCDLAPEVIDALVAEYLLTCALEFCPQGFVIKCVSPIGLVAKKTFPFFRLVIAGS
eukprot:844239-Rhodomonas_salina.1